MTSVECLERAVRSRADQVHALCRQLVAEESVNPPGDTVGAAAVVYRYLAAARLGPELVAEDTRKPNVVATIASERAGPHLLLNVHLDTMPTGPTEQWTVNPFELTERTGRWYGLGMGNMKGAAAAMAAAFVVLSEQRDSWGGSITFTAVSDEVVFGDAGAAHLIDTVPELADPDAVLCGEGPGYLRLGLAEKGLLWVRVSAAADGGHASGAARGQTATARLASALVRLDELNDHRVELPIELAHVPPSQTDATRLSVNAGTIRGGTFIGQRAIEATADLDIRVPPGLTIVAVEGLLRGCIEGIEGVELHRLRGWDPNWTPPTHPIVAAVEHAAGVVRGQTPEPSIRLPASDASRWRARGVGAVCYGPQPTLSSGVDDYAEAADVLDCAVIYATAASAFLSTDDDVQRQGGRAA